MSLVIHNGLRSLFMAIVVFSVSLAGIVFVTAPAQAAQLTSADLFVLCNEAQDGSATVYVQNVRPEGEAYWVTRQYENGHIASTGVGDGSDISIPVFGPYGAPLGNEGDNAESVTVTLMSNNPMVEFDSVTFDRNPQCGERPNRPPVVHDVSASGTRYDDTIIVPIDRVSDPDGDTLTFRLMSTPAHGTAEMRPPTADYPSAAALIAYHPDTTFVGDEAMTFRASDGKGGFASATATVTVNDSTPVTAPAPTFTEPTRSHVTGQVVVPTQSGVRYQVESPGLFEHDASGMTIDLPQGRTVTVKAFTTQSGTTLVGTKSWQHEFTYLLRVANRDGTGQAYINKVRVTNPNKFGVWYSYGTFTTTSSLKQDGRLWLEPGASQFVGTARKVLGWTGSGQDWSDKGTTKTTQIRPKGKIVFDCAGRRRVVRFYMNNRASTRTVLFTAHVAAGFHNRRRVGAGDTRIYRQDLIRPGWRMRLTADLPSRTVVLARAITPRTCR